MKEILNTSEGWCEPGHPSSGQPLKHLFIIPVLNGGHDPSMAVRLCCSTLDMLEE
jgi:hypothetical protein